MKKKLKKTIVLFGMKHCGKSTHARILADMLCCPFFDTDAEIVRQTGMQPREIYSKEGESGFFLAEERSCRTVAEKVSHQSCVVATGGGICNNIGAITVLRPFGVFVFLSVDEKIAADRIVKEAVMTDEGFFGNLPAYIAKKNPHTELDVRACFHTFYTDRTEKYKKLADYCIPMEEESIRNNTGRILEFMKSAEIVISD
jgi:shikimate kinase